MAQTLEQYIAEATQANQPAANAVQTQLDALNGRLDTTNQQINKSYAQQQAGLNRARNAAAETASMQAAGSGGSFGGAANIANRKYYDQTFVPAITQLQTNQANDLATARQNIEDQRTALNAQNANLQAQANQQALAQYYADRQLEQQLAVQRAQVAAQNASNEYLMRAMQESKGTETKYTLDETPNKWGGYNWTDADGNLHRAATVAAGLGGNFSAALTKVLQAAANQGDWYSKLALEEINKGASFARNTTGQSTGNDVYDVLGIRRVQ